MNRTVKTFKIIAAMTNHRPRERRPSFFGNLHRAGDEKLIVWLHQTNVEHRASNVEFRAR